MNSEFLGSKHRGKLMMLTQAFFSAGEVVLAAVAFRIRPWRSQTFGLLLLYIPTVVMSATILYESPRWLLLKVRVPRSSRDPSALCARRAGPCFL